MVPLSLVNPQGFPHPADRAEAELVIETSRAFFLDENHEFVLTSDLGVALHVTDQGCGTPLVARPRRSKDVAEASDSTLNEPARAASRSIV